MSLDGFIAGPNDGPDNPLGDGGEALFRWYGSGDTEFTMLSGEFSVKASAERAALMKEMHASIGAELQLALNDDPAAKAYQQAMFEKGQPGSRRHISWRVVWLWLTAAMLGSLVGSDPSPY